MSKSSWWWRWWWRQEHPKPPQPKPPPPPSEPVSKWKNPPWAGKGVHVAWAFTSGQYSPQQLADKMAQHGVNWAALEVNPAEANEAYAVPFRDALRAHGLKFAIWERDDTQKSYPETVIEHVKRLVNTYEPDFYGADIEVFPVEEPTFPAAFSSALPDLPRIAICAGLNDASFYVDWIAADWDCMTEAYSGPLGKPPLPGVAGSMDSDAKWRGFKKNWLGFHSVPILEVESENSAALKTQLPAVSQWGKNFSIWDAESMTDDDWAAFAAV